MKPVETVTRFHLAVAIVAFLAPSARADDCVRVDTSPPHATLSLKGDNISTAEAPGLYCTLEPHRTYRLTVSYPNHEPRSLKLRFNGLDQPPGFSGMRLSHLARSMILPGWGQTDLGYRSRAVMAFSTAVFAGFKFNQAYGHYVNERDQRDEYMALIDEGNTDPETARRAEQSKLNVDKYDEHILAVAATGGYVYLWNLVESVLLSTPPGKQTTGDGKVVLSVPQRSKARAAVRSVFFPGLGQKYYGGESRGVFLQVLFLTGVYGTLDAKLRYDLSDVRSKINHDAAAADPSDVDAQLLAEISQQTRDDDKQLFQIWGATTAGIWVIALIDAIARGDSGGSRVKPGRLEMTSGLRGGVVRTGLAVHF